jgi:hypothetical protein
MDDSFDEKVTKELLWNAILKHDSIIYKSSSLNSLKEKELVTFGQLYELILKYHSTKLKKISSEDSK